jgi:N-acetylmuramoyl-L-alanine amidase
MRLIHILCVTIAIVIVASGLRLDAAESTIAIDVGHSTFAPGAASARGVPEFQFNKELAAAILDRLSSDGTRVFLIGSDGRMTDLQKRTEQARAGKATFLLSIHHDSVQPQYLQEWNWQGRSRHYSDRFSGYSLFVSRANQDLTSSLRCASAIGAALKRQGLRPSPHHSENIPGEAREWADEENGVYYYDGLSVLRNAPCPAVLFEAGIIVNRGEEQKIGGAETRHAIVSAVKQGLTACGMLK